MAAIPVYVPDVRLVGVLEEELARRREWGLDLWDEVWEGVLHMSPPPHGEHQELKLWLGEVLRELARRHGFGRVIPELRFREPGTPPEGPETNYRVPDLAVLATGRTLVRGWAERGVSLVIEVRSPREIVLAKLPFYADRKVREVLYIDWQTGELELRRLGRRGYLLVKADRGGWLTCETAGLRVRRRRARSRPKPEGALGRIEVEDARGGGPLPPP